MSPENNQSASANSTQLQVDHTLTGLVDTALDVILGSDDLADLCKRAVEHPALNNIFTSAHILLASPDLNYDVGHGHDLPNNYLALAAKCLKSGRLQHSAALPQVNDGPHVVAIPFTHQNKVEAVGVVVLAPGESGMFLTGDFEPILAKLIGYFLATKVGLGL